VTVQFNVIIQSNSTREILHSKHLSDRPVQAPGNQGRERKASIKRPRPWNPRRVLYPRDGS